MKEKAASLLPPLSSVEVFLRVHPKVQYDGSAGGYASAKLSFSLAFGQRVVRIAPRDAATVDRFPWIASFVLHGLAVA